MKCGANHNESLKQVQGDECSELGGQYHVLNAYITSPTNFTHILAEYEECIV